VSCTETAGTTFEPLGIVTVDENGERLPGVRVEAVAQSAYTEFTDIRGEAQISLPNGNYSLNARMPGYVTHSRAVTMTVSEQCTVLFSLAVAPIKGIQ